MEHSDQTIMIGRHGEQCDFQNNEMEHFDQKVTTGWDQPDL